LSQGPVLLFLCGGRRVKLLAEFRAALAARARHSRDSRDSDNRNTEGRLLTTDTEPRAATSFFADATFLVPPCAASGPFAEAVARICEREGVTAVIPLTCAALATVPVLRRRIGPPVLGGSDEAIGISVDKLRTAEYFARRGLATPEVVAAPTPTDLPLFCRPRRAEGSRGAFAVTTPAALGLAAADPDNLFTRFVAGREFTMDCYKDRAGEVRAVVPRERLRVRAGEVEQSVIRHDPELIEQTARSLRDLDFWGPATVQAIRAGGVAHFTEINLRFGGGVTLSLAAGLPSPAWLLDELDGGTLGPPAAIRWGLGMARYDEECYFSEAAGAPA
jgi:carbamoyl-phosphate synthase large subunit